jgi:hypothetical protein
MTKPTSQAGPFSCSPGIERTTYGFIDTSDRQKARSPPEAGFVAIDRYGSEPTISGLREDAQPDHFA